MKSPFDLVCDMEGPLGAARGMAFAIQLMADSMERDTQGALTAVACEVERLVKSVEKMRDEVFHALHPNKGKYVPVVES